MCSYKVWIWMTVVYSIPLILTLLFSDVISLVGLNAPRLLQFETANLQKPNQSSSWSSDNNDAYLEDTMSILEDTPKLGEPEAFKRIAYEDQLRRNLEQDNSVESDETIKDDDIPLGKQEELNDPKGELKQDELVTTTNDSLLVDDQTSSTKQKTASTASVEVNDDQTNNEIEDENRPHEPKSTTGSVANDKMQNDDPTDKGQSEEKKGSGTSKPNDHEKLKDEDDKGQSEEKKGSSTSKLDEDDKGKQHQDDRKEGKDENKEKKEKEEKKEEGKKEKSKQNKEKAEAVKEQSKSEILKSGWNLFLDGLYANNNKLTLNIFVFIKIGFRILSLITLPLLVIGNQTGRSTYIKPFKLILLLQFLFSLAITIYYGIASTECEYYKDIRDWFSKHFTEPDNLTGKNMAKLYLLITFADLFPYLCIVSLILIKRRERQITRKKEESSSENWDMQLRPIGLPRLKTNSEHISPLNLHFNQPSNHNDNPPLTAGLITNEEISINNQPFSYTSNNQTSSLPCYDNHGFNKS